ncbi:MAG: L,D-transpeptidase [Burkholderiales bacterium]|nr:L,D-transpeptidase [Burkholderiales bacterium]
MLRLPGLAAMVTVLAVAGALTADTLAMGRKPARPAAPTRALPVDGAEAAMVSILRHIAEDRLGTAQTELDRLLATNPNFRLAQLVKGDLLMARSRPIQTIGNAPNAPADRLQDLRDEAQARLARAQAAMPGDKVPAYLLKLTPEQKHAIVVDTDRSTLYVFENRDGVPHYVADYYITIGKNGIDKVREGDKKTPLGVYHVTASLSPQKVGDFYGSGAFPINYPNEWDRRNGRNGHGIWLHGTPRDTYSRPPRASDGCVVLTNDDMTTIARNLQIGVTPVIIASTIDWVAPQDVHRARDELEAAVEQWRKDWESRRADDYLSHYAAGFSSGSTQLAAWSAQKRAVNASKEWVKVSLDDASMFLYPGREPLAVVTFQQNYSSNNLSNSMRKRQYWIRDGDRWKILYEGAA